MLVTGITAAVVCSMLIVFPWAFYAIPVLSATVLVFYFVKKFGLRKFLFIPTACICALIFTFTFYSYTAHNVVPLTQFDNTVAGVSGTVTSLPEDDGGFISFTLTADRIGNTKTNKTKLTVMLPKSETHNTALYDYIYLPKTSLRIPRTQKLKYDYSSLGDGILLQGSASDFEKITEAEKDAYYYCLKFRESVCKKITLFTDENEGGLLKGMIFGDTSDISGETTVAFRNSGISHLLAVSGLHTTLYCGLLIGLMSFFKISEKFRNLFCLVFLLFFSAVSGFTPSVIRSALMMAVILAAPFFRRNPEGINSLGFSVVLLLLDNPYIILNVSFQLSSIATLGVLLATRNTTKNDSFTRKIKPQFIGRLISSILLSLKISLYAAIFTLPVSAYHFGVIGILSPITNLLTVQVSFYATVTGIIATALAYIPSSLAKEFAILLFGVTDFFCDVMVGASQLVSDFKYCTIPIHKSFLIPGTVICCLIIFTGFLITRLKKKQLIFKLSCVLGVMLQFIAILIPLYAPPFKTQVTLVYCENGIQLIVREGTEYAMIFNSNQRLNSSAYNSLPKATSETLEYFIPTYISKTALLSIENVFTYLEPQSTLVSPQILSYLKVSGVNMPENTVIKSTSSFLLSNKIYIEIVDTDRIKYAIIKGTEKTVYVHLYGNTDFKAHLDTEHCDIAVFNSCLPEVIPENTELTVISGNIHTSSLKKAFPDYKGEALSTFQSGDISFYI